MSTPTGILKVLRMPQWLFSVRMKFAALTGLLLALIATFIYWYVPRQLETKSKREIAERARSISAMMAYNVSLALQNDDRPSVCAAVISAKRNPGLDYVMVVDAEGNVIATYDSLRADSLEYAQNDIVDRISADGLTFQTSLPVIAHDKLLGRVYVGLSLDEVHAEIQQSRSTIALVSACIWLAGILLTILLSTVVTRPLERIAKAADRLAQGDWNQRVSTNARDEIGHLARAFNTMVDDLSHAYARVQQSEKNYRDLFESASDLILSLDSEGRFEFVNRSFRETLGYTDTEVVHLHIYDIVADEHLSSFKVALLRALEGDVAKRIETVFATRAGREVVVEGSLSRSYDDEHHSVSIRGIFRDITERRQNEAAILQEKARFEQLFENVPAGVVLTDESERIIRINKAFERMFGFTIEDIAGKSINHVVIPDELRAEGDRYSSQILQGDCVHVEALRRRKDGSTLYVELYGVPVMAGGKALGMFAMYVDITERRRAEEAIRLEKARFEQLFENAPIGIILADNNERILHANGTFQKLFAYSLQELCGRRVNDTIVPPSLRSEGNELSQRVLLGESLHVESTRIARDGKEVNVEIYGIPIRIAGVAVGVFGMYVDITERKRAEEQRTKLLRDLENINKELNDFAYIVSHDLKAPLRAIGSLVNWLAEDYGDKLGDDGKELLQVLLGRTKRMHDLIEGILRYSRIGRTVEAVAPVDLDKLLPEIVDSIAPPEHIRVKIHHPLPMIQGEATRIQQVFQNLITNAVKFMDKPTGVVEVGCTRENGHWKFSIADNGPGIEQRHFQKIFQIFQTLSSRDDYESTGIGLTIVKKIVEMYGGRIWVESEVGSGTTFYFTLPAEQQN